MTRGGVLIACAAMLCIAGCVKQDPWKPGMSLNKENLKIGVLYISDPVTERSGYSSAHEQGIVEMQQALGLKDEQIICKVDVIDTDLNAIENAIRSCIAVGARLIIATSWGYMEACEKLAGEFPRVVFAYVVGNKSNGFNLTYYFGRIYHARYLSGLAAGLKTRSGKIGYVAAMGKDNSEVTGGLNAFALGVEKVNPAARIHVRLTHSWFDPIAEQDAARELIAAGCDVIAQHCDTNLPQLEARRAGVWGIGYNTDMSKDLPETVLTSVVWHWGVYYTALARSIVDGTFSTAPCFGSLADGMVDISPLSEGITAPGTAKIIAAERDRLASGAFDVFDGVLETNDGRRIGTEGTRLSDTEILNGINWYYRTVVER